jgi:hypothetical protein
MRTVICPRPWLGHRPLLDHQRLAELAHDCCFHRSSKVA